MAIVACPKCNTKLKLPNTASGAIRCPKCQAIFNPPKPTAAPAFEVVDDEPTKPAPAPAKPAPPRPAAAAPAPAKPAPARPSGSAAPPAPRNPPATPDSDFEVVDDEPPPPPKKKIVAKADDEPDDDDDDDRPRKKSRKRDDDDDDDDDRPRGRRKDRDRDDDDDDRPRKKKRKRDDDDDDDDRPAKRKSQGGPARIAVLMLMISLWIYVGTFAILALFAFLALVGASIPSGLMLVTGLIGLVNWVVAAVGLGFSIAGPAKARGFAIATTAVAAIHLVMGFVVANDSSSGAFGAHAIQFASFYNKLNYMEQLMKDAAKDPNGSAAKELREMQKSDAEENEDLVIASGMATGGERKTRSTASKMRWTDMATFLPYSDSLIAVLSYHSKGFSDYILGLLTGLLEVARIILMLLLLKALAQSARCDEGETKIQLGLISVASGVGVALLILLLSAVMIDSSASSLKTAITKSQPSSKSEEDPFKNYMSSVKNWSTIGELLIYLIHGGVMVLPAIGAMQVFGAMGSRSR